MSEGVLRMYERMGTLRERQKVGEGVLGGESEGGIIVYKRVN